MTIMKRFVLLIALLLPLGAAQAQGALAAQVAADVAADAAAKAAKEAERISREAPLARDELELFPQLRGKLLDESRQQSFGQALGEERFIVRVKQVTNLSGNNPWDTREPLLNFNGVRVADLAALLALIRGGPVANNASFADCIRTVPMNLVVPPNVIYSGNFDLNPTTLACTLIPPGTPGNGTFSIVVDNPSTPMNTTYCIGGIPGTFWNPVAGPVCVPYALGAVVSFQARSTTGRLIQVQFRATAGAPPTLQVIAITPLN